MRCLLVVVMLAAAACGDDGNARYDAAPTPDAAPTTDGNVVPPDAPVAPSGRELTAGAAVLESPSFTLEVQVGHAVSQQPATAGDRTLEGSAVIKR